MKREKQKRSKTCSSINLLRGFGVTTTEIRTKLANIEAMVEIIARQIKRQADKRK